jgi:hypothetical protein
MGLLEHANVEWSGMDHKRWVTFGEQVPEDSIGVVEAANPSDTSLELW